MRVNQQMIIPLLIIMTVISQTCIVEGQIDQTKQLNFGFNYSCFKSEGDYIYVELHFSAYSHIFKYTEFEEKFKAEFLFEVNLFKADSLVNSRSWKNVNYVDSLAQLKKLQRVSSVSFLQAVPGDYMLKLKLKDVLTGNVVEKEAPLSLKPFDKIELCISDIELASDIKRSSEQNQYYKNGYQVIPNTDGLYGTGLPMLMFYYEVYNLKKQDEADSTTYTVQYRILDSSDEPVREFSSRKKLKPGNSVVEVGGINIITLLSGTYFLQVDIQDSINNSSANKTQKFFVYRSGDFENVQPDSLRRVQIGQQAARMIENVYSSMNEQEIDEEFAAASYIASSDEKSIYKNLDIKGKQEFMVEFWTKRDNTPDTPQNEFRDNYISRVRIAVKQFTGFKKGWKTDEGRILLIYGSPDEIERFPSSTDDKAYRIWHYYSLQGGVIFIFVDRRGWGEYELIHSTARGEIFDSDWERWINPAK